MQNASVEYKQSMKRILRNPAHIKVDIGIINPDAQNSAVLSETEVTYFSDTLGPFKSENVPFVYCTMEENLSKVDGSMVFLPRESDYIPHKSGIVTKILLGMAKIELGIKSLDIRGLTIDFSDNYPEDFNIITNNTSVSIVGNDKRIFETHEIFLDTDYFIIAPTKMARGQNRLRIFKFLCGLGVSFGNEIIKTASINDFVSPITKTLPAIDFNFTIDNSNLAYNADDYTNAVNYLKTEQLCNVYSGYELDNGVVEWIKSGTFRLKSWDADDTKASFTAVDRLEYIAGTYYKGRYYSSGRTLYSLAEDVFLDAGLELKEYRIDETLRDIVVYNPIPPVKHKEALQIIANAGRCILYQDREGIIVLEAPSNQLQDYIFEKDKDITQAVKCTQLELVKEIRLSLTSYNLEEQVSELKKNTILLSQDARVVEFTFNEAVEVISFECTSLPGNIYGVISDSSNYFVRIEFFGITNEIVTEIVVRGKKYKKENSLYVKPLDTIGKIETWSNPLVSYEEHAKDLVEWLAKYFLSDKEYSISYRGDPRIDAYDFISLERSNQETIPIALSENKLSFNGAWSASAKARRLVHGN